jgi:hypothetical protein
VVCLECGWKLARFPRSKRCFWDFCVQKIEEIMFPEIWCGKEGTPKAFHEGMGANWLMVLLLLGKFGMMMGLSCLC